MVPVNIMPVTLHNKTSWLLMQLRSTLPSHEEQEGDEPQPAPPRITFFIVKKKTSSKLFAPIPSIPIVVFLGLLKRLTMQLDSCFLS